MNILILTHSYPDSNHKWRGVFVQQQARALGRIHKVIVVYFKADYSQFAPFSKYSFEKKNDDQLTVYEVTIKRSFPVITQLKYLSNTYKFLIEEIFKKEKIDIIHSHLSYPAGFLGTLIQKRKGIPNILTEHSTIRLYNRSFIHKLCVRYALRNASGVISVSNSLKNEIIPIRKKSVNVIPNIVDTGLFELSENREDPILNIGFLGGLNNTNKGLDLLLKAVSMLENTKYKLHIGGDGKLLDHFKKLAAEAAIENNCRFYGEIARDEIPQFYSQLDLFILPSRYETFGIVLIEAMAGGVPVIATKCGGPEDIVTESTGVLVEKDNPEMLANVIRTMAGNLRSFNKETIRNYAREKFGEEAVAKEITELYREKI
jgi:glycosyltransferase involved in cell wall biosynthesis